MGRIEESMESYRQAIRSKPDHADAHFNLAVLLQDASDLGEAERMYQETLVLDPGHLEALANLGTVFHAQDRYAEAVGAYRTAIGAISEADHGGAESSEAPSEWSGMLSALFYALGTALDRLDGLGRPCPSDGADSCKEQSIEAYRQALDHDPEHALARHALAAHLADESVSSAPRE